MRTGTLFSMANFVNLYVPGFIRPDKTWDRSVFAFSADGGAIVVSALLVPTRLPLFPRALLLQSMPLQIAVQATNYACRHLSQLMPHRSASNGPLYVQQNSKQPGCSAVYCLLRRLPVPFACRAPDAAPEDVHAICRCTIKF